MPLTKDQIIAANDLPTVEVQTPEWGGSVYVRTLSGAELEKALKLLLGTDKEGTIPTYVSMVLSDQDGNRLFTEAEVEQLGKKNGQVLRRVAEAASKLNFPSKESVEEAKKN